MALQGLGIDNTPEKRGCSPVAEKAGFPIILARQDFELATDKSMDAYDVNPSAVFLRKSCDPDQPGLGLAPLGWMGRIGTVLVVGTTHDSVTDPTNFLRSAKTRRNFCPSMWRRWQTFVSQTGCASFSA